MLKFENVSRIYTKSNKEDFYALKDFTYCFDKKGMYCILGKSGSGKSTIANLGALLDEPSKGQVLFNGKNINSYKPKVRNYYHSKVVSTIFQHYNLLPDLNVIENIIVPRLALQENEKKAIEDGMDLLKELGFEGNFAQKSAKNLSGGEAQRVAILRAIINNPDILIADEPTGALDENNSKIIMELLKRISKKKIVIVITHNTKLAKEFGDEILYIKDGQLEKCEQRNFLKETPVVDLKPNLKLGRNSKWLYRFATRRLKKNKSKNLLSAASIIFGMISIFLIIGFSIGSGIVVNEKCLERFDYGVGEISKTETIDLPDSMLDLTKMTRLKQADLNEFKYKYPYLQYDINFDALFNNNIMKISNKEISGISFEFVYSFNYEYCNDSLLYKGDLAKNDGILINAPAEEIIKEKLNEPTILGKDLLLSSRYELMNVINGKEISDEFTFKRNFKIYGCTKEFSFLAVPKIYISYTYIKSLLEMDIIYNLSKEKASEITWYDYIKYASDTDEITSFSHKVFAPTNELNNFELLIKQLGETEYSIDCSPIMLKDTFITLMDGVKVGLYIFSLLTIIGTVLIIGINGFSSYTFERKNSAIYFAFGVSKDQIFTIFIVEAVIVTIVAFLLSIIGAYLLQYLINFVVFKYFGISNIVLIPFKSFNGIPLFLIFASFICALLVCIVCTYIPLAVSKKINLKKELSDE